MGDQAQFTAPNQQFFDNDGAVLSGGYLYFYEAGTSTPLDTYSDSAKTIANTNPVVLDSAGRAGAIYMVADDYKIVLKDSAGTTIWTRDNYTISGTSSVGGGLESSGGTLRLASLVNNQTGTSYTILTGDRGKLLTFSNTNTIAVVLPQADSSSFPDGWVIDIENRGIGTVTITPDTSTVDGASTIVIPSKGGVRIFSDGTNYFTQSGTVGLATEVTVASATTTDLGAQSSHVLAISGTTTITSFGSSASVASPIYFIRFTGALTLTHNATSLIIPAAANITTAAGDMAVAKYEGSGNWRVVSYTKASGKSISDTTTLLGSTTYATNTTLSTAIPADDTIPQNTEGDQIMTVTAVPTSASKTIVVEWVVYASASGGATQHITAPLFVDTTASALDAPYATSSGGNNVMCITGFYSVNAASTTSRDYKVRIGSASGSVYPNGTAGTTRLYGGVTKCKMFVYER